MGQPPRAPRAVLQVVGQCRTPSGSRGTAEVWPPQERDTKWHWTAWHISRPWA